MAELILSAAALGVLGLTLQLLVLRLAKCCYLRPLVVALLALAMIVSGPLVFQVWPALTFWYIAALPVAFLGLPPSLYLYTQALTDRQAWHWQWRHLTLYWPQLLAIPLALLIIGLPAAEQQALFFSEVAELQGQMLITAVAFFLATILWLGLSLFYVIRISLLLRQYRRQLREIFAADAGKRLGWLTVLQVALLLSWSYAVAVFLAESQPALPWLSDTGVLLLALILVWLLCACGLNQQPGFAELLAKPDIGKSAAAVVEVAASLEIDKYQRSALGAAQAQRIAGKVQQAVYQDALYLDSTLTLYKLAEHIGVSAQYLSQTLNQTLQQSFYDYINEARIVAAKQQLQQTDNSVLEIAMAVGFNARSSFYKAFKASTGVTPNLYRAQQAEWNTKPQ